MVEMKGYERHVMAKVLTFTADPDSSKLERKAWVIKGLNLSGPVESTQHASQSFEEITEIDETTEIDISCGLISLADMPYTKEWFDSITCNMRKTSEHDINMPLVLTKWT